jgi:hypothetical protein
LLHYGALLPAPARCVQVTFPALQQLAQWLLGHVREPRLPPGQTRFTFVSDALTFVGARFTLVGAMLTLGLPGAVVHTHGVAVSPRRGQRPDSRISEAMNNPQA